MMRVPNIPASVTIAMGLVVLVAPLLVIFLVSAPG
jgi:hypothetical protein